MTPEKAAKQAANLLMFAFKDAILDSPSLAVGSAAHSVRLGPSGQRFVLRAEGLEALSKAARQLVPLLDTYPLEKVIDHLAAYVVEEKDVDTPLPQVHDRLRGRILQFLQGLASQGEWEVVYAVRCVDLSGGPFTIGPCSFYTMDDHQFRLWGQRFAAGLYAPPDDAPLLSTWFQHESALLDQVVASAKVRATDHEHARAKGRKRIEEILNVLRYGQIVIDFPSRYVPEIGLWAQQWQHDHSIVIRLDKPGFSTNQSLGGAIGIQLSICRHAPGWNGLARLVSLELSARSELQLRMTTALEWIGQAAAAPSSPIRLVALVTALEALLIERSESLGKKFKLANRVSKLVGQTQAEQQTLAKEVEELYETRSECVHAGLVDVEKDELRKAVQVIAKTVDALHHVPYSTIASLNDLLKMVELDPARETSCP